MLKMSDKHSQLARQDLDHRAKERRQLLRGIGGMGAGILLSPLVHLFGCSTDTATGTDAQGTTDAGAGSDAGTGSSTQWATGGTAVMSGSYADPFTVGLGSVCTLYKASTLGPCHALTVERKDISEGGLGLPVRVSLLLVSSTCQPLSGATIEVWHCNPNGLYSGSDASNMCTNNDSAARAGRWFRGIQTADSSGRVDFNTCFPGWYSSRTIHIHFTVRYNGKEFTSQLFFDDSLNNEIIATQPLYKTRGAKDTTNLADKVINESALVGYTFQTQRQSDGALLAWKTLAVV